MPTGSAALGPPVTVNSVPDTVALMIVSGAVPLLVSLSCALLDLPTSVAVNVGETSIRIAGVPVAVPVAVKLVASVAPWLMSITQVLVPSEVGVSLMVTVTALLGLIVIVPEGATMENSPHWSPPWRTTVTFGVLEVAVSDLLAIAELPTATVPRASVGSPTVIAAGATPLQSQTPSSNSPSQRFDIEWSLPRARRREPPRDGLMNNLTMGDPTAKANGARAGSHRAALAGAPRGPTR